MTEIIALALVKYGPELARSLYALFQKKEVTAADWEALFALAETPYEAYDPKPIPPA